VRHEGLEQAIKAAGSVSALARGLGLAQPSVSGWTKIPAERVLAVETLTGVPRSILRPDLYDGQDDIQTSDEVNALRAQHYGLLAALLQRAPTEAILKDVAAIKGDTTELGLSLIALADAARHTDAHKVSREFFNLFIGVGRGELMPYGSYYLTGFLHERPLADVRGDLIRLGLERIESQREPEDHIGILCEVMAGFAAHRFEANPADEKSFFEKHLRPWAERFFVDLETAKEAHFYKAVGQVGRLFIAIETEAFALPQ
jgi:TorA maturation chaperone TorD